MMAVLEDAAVPSTVESPTPPGDAAGSSTRIDVSEPAESQPVPTPEKVTLSSGPPASSVQRRATAIHADKVQLIKSWISDCIKKHTRCGARQEEVLPSRVIDLGPPGSANPSPPILVQNIDHNKRGTYATLSHCWGEKLPLRTTRGNLSSHMKGFELSSLSQSFKDAITVTRTLGLRYLWIDSLCIIQDDNDDWECEAMRMGQIYQNSFVTIAASVAKNSYTGFLGPQKRENDLFRHDKWFNEDVASSLMFSQGPLSTRAWAFQERILATRLLHFCHDEIVFECSHGLQCECAKMPERPTSHLKHLFSTNSPDLWPLIITFYSHMDLTYEKDRLPALSSVGSMLNARAPDTYIAGIWKNNITRQLLWAGPYGGGLTYTKEYVAPSFSWASRVGNVSWGLTTSGLSTLQPYEELIEVIEVACVSKSSNIFGPLDSSYLRVRGCLFPGQLAYKDTSSGLVDEYFNTEFFEFEAAIDSEEESPAYFLPLVRVVRDSGSELAGLLLKKTDSQDLTFQRCGCASGFKASNNSKDFKLFNFFIEADRRDITII